MIQAVTERRSIKKVFLEISQNSKEKTCARVSFLIRLQAETIFKKETLAQVFSCEFYKIYKNTFSYKTLPVAVSEMSLDPKSPKLKGHTGKPGPKTLVRP